MTNCYDTVMGFDVETTGFSPWKNRIFMLGFCGPFSKNRMLVNPFNGPDGYIHYKIEELTGTKTKDVKYAPRFSDLLFPIMSILSTWTTPPHYVVGYNTKRFDVPFINCEFERAGSPFRLDPERILDLLFFSRKHHKDLESRKLGKMLEYYEINTANTHKADDDAEASRLLFFAMQRAGTIPLDPEEALREQNGISTQQKRR